MLPSDDRFPFRGKRFFFGGEVMDGMVLTDLEKRLFRRQIQIPEIGEAGQARLLKSRTLVVGLGGLGSPALFYLTACGVGEIGMMDGDTVDLSNLQRQILHGFDDVGRLKTSSAHEALRRLRPDVRFNVYPESLSQDNAVQIISQYDFIIEATDNFESKFLINDVCVRLGKAFSHAGILGMIGQTMTIVPGKGPCFRCLFEDIPPSGVVRTTDQTGVLGSLPGVLGAIQSTEAIKYLTGIGRLLVGRLLTFDALTMAFREISLPMDKRCRECGKPEEG